jgi:hypothetical protein
MRVLAAALHGAARLLTLGACLAGCDSLPLLGGGDDTAGGACARTPPLDWDNFGDGIVTKHCTGCHSSLLPADLREGAPLGVDFDTYEGVLQYRDRIVIRAVSADGGMPPGGGPSEEERALLGEWLDCGVADDAKHIEGAPE